MTRISIVWLALISCGPPRPVTPRAKKVTIRHDFGGRADASKALPKLQAAAVRAGCVDVADDSIEYVSKGFRAVCSGTPISLTTSPAKASVLAASCPETAGVKACEEALLMIVSAGKQ